MEPTLHEGDWLLVDPEAFRRREARVGDLIVAEGPSGLVVKRVAATLPDGLLLAGDATPGPGHDHELSVPPSAVVGRPWFRYMPLRRLGPLR